MGGFFQFKYFHISIRPTYPCRSSGIESSINAVFNRLNPPVLKLMPPLVPVLKGWLLVFDNPCKSKVPNGFFERALFTSLRFSVKFWRKSPPPVDWMMMENFCYENFCALLLECDSSIVWIEKLLSFTKLNENCSRKYFKKSCLVPPLMMSSLPESLSWCFFQFYI